MFFQSGKDKKFYKAFCAILLLSVILSFILILRGFYSISADDSARSVYAYNYLHGILPPDFVWLPLHTLIMSAALALYNDLIWAPRVVSIIFGVFSLSAITLFSHILFNNKKITLLTAFFACLFPLRIMFSAVPLSEITFTYFIVMGSANFVKWLQSNKSKEIYLSSLFFTIASFIRYEGWIFSFGFFMALLIIKFVRKENISKAVIFYSTCILFSLPAAWMVFHAIINGNPLGFLEGQSGVYKNLVGDSLLLRLKYNFLTNFIFQTLFYFIFPGLIAAVYLARKNKIVKYFFHGWVISFLIISASSLAGFGNPSHAFWRIPFIWNYLLFPFLAYALFSFLESNIFTLKIRKLITFILLPVCFIIQLFFLTAYSPFTENEMDAGKFLKKVIEKEPDTRILIDTSDWGYFHIFAASGHPENFIVNSDRFSAKNEKPILNENIQESLSSLKSKNISYVVLRYKRLMKSLPDSNFKKIKSYRFWEIYKLKY